MSVMSRCVVGALLLMSVAGAQAEVYRWVDKDGKVQYSDNPPSDARVERRNIQDNKVDAAGPGFETKRAMQMAPVVLYTWSQCKDPCDQARKFLSARKVPYKEIAVATQEQVDTWVKLVGHEKPQAPTMQVGSKPLEGFETGAWNAALDVAGYPKPL